MFRYELGYVKCPTGVYVLVGTMPQYMERFVFETEKTAQEALEEALYALAHPSDPGLLDQRFARVFLGAPRYGSIRVP